MKMSKISSTGKYTYLPRQTRWILNSETYCCVSWLDRFGIPAASIFRKQNTGLHGITGITSYKTRILKTTVVSTSNIS